MLSESVQITVSQVLSSHKQLPGALLPILHGIQDAVGYIPSEGVDQIARELNLSRAEVHGVVTFIELKQMRNSFTIKVLREKTIRSKRYNQRERELCNPAQKCFVGGHRFIQTTYSGHYSCLTALVFKQKKTIPFVVI